jgi:hypothetical protein
VTHRHRTGLRAVRHTPDPADEGPSVPTPWKLRVGIGVPSGGSWHSGFGFSLVTMIGHFERSHVDVEEERRPEVVLIAIDGHLPDVRTRILGEAVRERCTHLLWLDSDMIFPPDTLHRLLRHNLPIVGANYPRRIFPHLPTAHYGGDPQGGVVWSEGNEGIERVKHVGFGCVLMDMRLVDAIDPPYFVFAPDGEHGLTTRGEDVYFCEKLLRDAGIPTHVDHNLSHEIGHVGEQVFGMAHAYTGRTVQAEMDAQRRAEEAAKAADVVTEAEAAGGAMAPWPEHDCEGECRHRSDCAVHNGPALEPGPCDCGADLANAVLEGADVPAPVQVRWAEADDGASWAATDVQPEAAE